MKSETTWLPQRNNPYIYRLNNNLLIPLLANRIQLARIIQKNFNLEAGHGEHSEISGINPARSGKEGVKKRKRNQAPEASSDSEASVESDDDI